MRVWIFTNNGATPVTSASIRNINGSTSGVVVKTQTLNAAGIGTSGVDLETAYTTDLWDGRFTTRLLANFLMQNYNTTNAPGTKSVSGLGAAGNDNIHAHGAIRHRHCSASMCRNAPISNGKMDPNLITGLTITQNNVPMIFYTNLNFTYKFASFFNSQDEVFLNVTNLFNQDPPVDVTSSSSFEHSTDFSLYDVLGRRFTMGLRVRL